ncbi:cysteine-rich secretory protein LCCL domain-containing 2-like [Apostichopus japonicus]|uniref:cysteine-rich secretory protein LCCL domain-containing 2-like n=1 Tax=Stichopus japonicus TaxID=307972 RepID=UPI003AB67239
MASKVLVLLAAAVALNTRSTSATYSSADETAILESHNSYRTDVSPSATDMTELVWDEGLAVQAQQWADNCLYEHPNKALYKDYANIGQNLFIQYPDSLGTKPPSPVTKPVTSWHNEVDYYDYYSYSCRPKKVCGHYTQVVWASTEKVGCGIKHCKLATTNRGKSYANAWLVACNYAPSGNYVGRKPYTTGNECSQCPPGSLCKNKLCSNSPQGESGSPQGEPGSPQGESGRPQGEPGSPQGEPGRPQGEAGSPQGEAGSPQGEPGSPQGEAGRPQGESGGDSCQLECQNCGTKTSQCTCNCQNGYFGTLCENYCEDTDSYCGNKWPDMFCGHFDFVNNNCPKMCGDCEEGPRLTNC